MARLLPLVGRIRDRVSQPALLNSSESNTTQFLARCIYEESDRLELMNELLDGVAEFADASMSNHLERDRVYRESFKLLNHLLPFVAPVLKDGSFAEEREWRLVSIAEVFDAEHMLFRQGKSMLVPYYAHRFESKQKGEIVESVVVGPTPHPGLASEGVRALLASAGFTSAMVSTSAIPYRSW